MTATRAPARPTAAPETAAGDHARSPATTRSRPPWIAIGVFAALVAFPYLAPFSLVGVGVQAATFTVVAAALVLLVGWVGQISLAHAALVGVGAYSTGWATAGWGLRFPFSLVVGGLFAGVAAAVLGSVALRVRGLYLAVATLIFSWMADAFLFRVPAVVQHAIIDLPVIGNPDGVPRFDLSDRRTMFFVAWGVALVVIFLAANLRSSRTGRAFFALRGSEVGAASLGIDVTRYKLLAFVISGFLAGVAGALIMLDARSVSPEDFSFTRSLFFLSVAVVGGLGSLGGAVASSAFFAGLNEVFFRVTWLGNYLDLVSAALLAIMLLLYRGGLAAVPSSIAQVAARVRALTDDRLPEPVRRWWDDLRAELAREAEQLRDLWGGVARRAAAVQERSGLGRLGDRARELVPRVSIQFPTRRPGSTASDAAAGAADHWTGNGHVAVDSTTPRAERPVVVEASSITVQFGGLLAVRDATIRVCGGEIVGLIGPNGAGKTTLFNAIAGLNSPTRGRVSLFGQDVTGMPVHERAALGVARTFQAIQLFPELDVFENLLVATHVHNRTGFLRHSVAADRSLQTELGCRRRVQEVVEQLSLEDVAGRRVADLPFGLLRVVELARALVTGFPFVMLDEPASGLDNAETERFGAMLRQTRDRGKTLLLIEHDVQMVTSLSDYIYVLNRGEIIAEGTPSEIQSSAAVRAAYLGEADDEEEAA